MLRIFLWLLDLSFSIQSGSRTQLWHLSRSVAYLHYTQSGVPALTRLHKSAADRLGVVTGSSTLRETAMRQGFPNDRGEGQRCLSYEQCVTQQLCAINKRICYRATVHPRHCSTSTTLHMNNLLHLCTSICCSTNLLLIYNLLHLTLLLCIDHIMYRYCT